MDISSSNYFSVSASTNKGMSGMISNMDTESMVKQMLSGTQGKIDKQMGLKQQAEWRQDIYRDVITSINDFQVKYLDTTYGSTLKTNFASTAFFNSMVSSVTAGDGVRIVSTGTTAPVGNTTVKVTSLATASKLASAQRMSDGTIRGKKLDADTLVEKLDKRVTFKIGTRGTDGTMATQEVTVNLNGITTEEDMLSKINAALGGKGFTADIFEGRLRLVSGSDDNYLSVVGHDGANPAGTSSALGLEMTGLSSFTRSDVTDAGGGVRHMIKGGVVDAAAGPGFTVTLDGVQKQITLNAAAGADGTVTEQSVADALNAELQKAFGGYVSAVLDASAGNLTLKTSFADNGLGHELVVTGMDAKTLGITPGSTSALNTGARLKDLRDAMGLVGDRFEFTINGERFSFTGNDSVGAVINAVNNSGAGVRMTYSTLTDTFQMEATSTGEKYGIKIEQAQGNLLTKLFGDAVPAGAENASKELTVGSVAGQALDAGFTAKSGASLKLSVDGTNYTFTLPQVNGEAYTFDKAEIVDRLNAWLADTFHDDGGNAAITYDGDTGTLNVADGSVVKFVKTGVDTYNAKAMEEAKKTDLGLAMGFAAEGKSNVAGAQATVGQIEQLEWMSGLTASGTAITDDMTLTALVAALGGGASLNNGRLVLTGTVPPLTADRLKELFGENAVKSGTIQDLNVGTGAAAEIKNGTDAELVINGVATTRSSNTFTIDGITLEATKAGTENTIGTKRDTDFIVEGFKSFVEDYNALVKKLTDLVDEKQSYRSYAPLTDDQKKEMSEREVELWEKKAKEGLLHRDSAIDSFLSQMRLAMYSKPSGSKLALYDIGIETTKWEDKGQLKLDETALRNALASDPNSVMILFTDKENGLGALLGSIIKSAANPSSASPGTLVQIAGVEGWGSETNNNLSNNISSIASRIKELQAKYQSERDRYWKQFNAMESALQSFNAQSSMISQQFSAGY